MTTLEQNIERSLKEKYEISSDYDSDNAFGRHSKNQK